MRLIISRRFTTRRISPSATTLSAPWPGWFIIDKRNLERVWTKVLWVLLKVFKVLQMIWPNIFQWMKFLWFFSFFCMLFNTPINLIFYQNDFEKPSLWMAIAAPILKNTWGFATASIMIGLIHKYGWILYDLMSFSGYRIFARISYATMIIQFVVIKLVITTADHPIVLSDINLVSYRKVYIINFF